MEYNFVKYVRSSANKNKPRVKRNRVKEKGLWLKNLVRDKRILELWEKGFSIEEISKDMNISKTILYAFFFRVSHKKGHPIAHNK